MKATVGMGRVAGVPVGLHWSVLGIVLLLVLWLSGWLPVALPGRPGATYFVAAVLAAALFLLSCSPTSWPMPWSRGGTASRSRASPCGCSPGWVVCGGSSSDCSW